jgi:selenide, water dikinase
VAKLSPSDLAQVLGKLPAQPENKNVLVGYDLSSDAGVFRLGDNVALVQTVDFFTPVADEPEVYGRIAAINALNDVYAMGGKPLTALSIVCYPQKEDLNVLRQILEGGQTAMNEDGVTILGGHSIDDAEIKIGYAVTGIVDPGHFITNARAQQGDALILTKPIGTGAISTAIKRGVASGLAVKAAMKAMTTSAALAAKEMLKAGAHACTDITGFGLLGHAYEMARASRVCLVIDTSRVPLLPDVLDLISQGMLTRGDKNNKEYVGDTVLIGEHISREMQSALFDPQTAGGLLISIEEARAEDLANKIEGAVIIGKVEAQTEFLIRLV